jgi:tRNA threonylcarbamoyladenosine biosynthesis protein TsaE
MADDLVASGFSRTSITTRSELETIAVGERLGRTLHAGSTVLLVGDLGAGKTALVRGIAAGLGLDPGEVSSPTFVLINEYRGRVTLHHVDLYRIEGAAVDDLGLEEIPASGGVLVIEWADRLPGPLADATRITISDQGDNVREILVEERQ